MKLKPATISQVHAVEAAMLRLEEARSFLRFANCPKALDRVRAALRSTGGALRHVKRRCASP